MVEPWRRYSSLSPVIYVRQDGSCGDKDPCYTSIQIGISLAQSPAIMEVSQEIYNENVFFNAPALLTRSVIKSLVLIANSFLEVNSS